MYLNHKLYPFLLIILLCGFSLPIVTNAQEVITLTADEKSEFILNPVDFQPDDEEASLFKQQPLGNLPKTEYTRHEREDGAIVIKAVSEKSASGLFVPIKADPEEFRYIRWEWKIESVLEDGDLTKKSGDDYPARIYITFDYDSSDLGFRDRVRYRAIRTFSSFDVPLRSLNYIWANKAEKGTIAESPYTDWVRLVAVQSGNEFAQEWKVETRDILEDYRKAFNEEPPKINGLSIMTDSDDTESNAKAYYGKIILSTEPFEEE